MHKECIMVNIIFLPNYRKLRSFIINHKVVMKGLILDSVNSELPVVVACILFTIAKLRGYFEAWSFFLITVCGGGCRNGIPSRFDWTLFVHGCFGTKMLLVIVWFMQHIEKII